MKAAIRIAWTAWLLWAGAGLAQDYEREKRWADEVVPGLVVGDAAWIEASSGRKFLALYAPVRDARAALVLVHGVGVHPDFGIIGALRSRLADAGYSTLSIQMPVLAADKRAPDYNPAMFPDAQDRIERSAAWLREREPGRPLVLISHSMGSVMSNAYLDGHPRAPFAAWVCLGIIGPYSEATWFAPLPILDVYADNDFPVSLETSWIRRVALGTTDARSRQVVIAGSDHYYTGREAPVAQAIETWLRALPDASR